MSRQNEYVIIAEDKFGLTITLTDAGKAELADLLSQTNQGEPSYPNDNALYELMEHDICNGGWLPCDPDDSGATCLIDQSKYSFDYEEYRLPPVYFWHDGYVYRSIIETLAESGSCWLRKMSESAAYACGYEYGVKALSFGMALFEAQRDGWFIETEYAVDYANFENGYYAGYAVRYE